MALNRRDERPGSRFKFQERNPEDVKRHAERQGNRFDSPIKEGFDMFRPRAGDNAVRILPPTWEGAKHFGYSIWVHPYVGADKSTYVCPRKMLSKTCPVCDASDQARADGDGDEADALKPQERYGYWVLDRDADDPLHPYFWLVSWTMDREITSHTIDKRNGGFLYVEHPETGYDFFFQRIGQMLKTRYQGMQFDRKATPICDDPDDQDEVLDFVTDNPIPDILNYYDSKHLERVVLGTKSEKDPLDEETGEEEDRGSRRRGGERSERGTARTGSDRRSRAADEDEPDARESRRGREGRRGRDAEEEDAGSRAGRERTRDRDSGRRSREEPQEEEDKPVERGRRAATEATSGRRGRDTEDDDPQFEGGRPRSRVREPEPEEDEEEERPSRTRSRASEDREERSPRSGASTRVERGTPRTRSTTDDEGDPEEDEPEAPARARTRERSRR